MKKIAIFGAGGFGREVHVLIEQINKTSNDWDFFGYFDDDDTKKGTVINGYYVHGGITELNKVTSELNIVFAIGNPIIKRLVYSKINNDHIKYPILIHPNAILGDRKYIEIGEGTIICAATIITCNIKIGKHVILNLACTVGHDTIISDYCSFMPTVNISGEVNIKESVYVGTGAKIINQLNIGCDSIIGAGAVVSKDIPDYCTAVGVPAKPIKFHNR